MSENYLIVGDVQAKRENLHLVKQLFTKVEEIGLDVIWLGDMLDRRGLIEAECLNTYYQYFRSSKLMHHVIVGNHDLINMYSKETALLPLKSLQNVRIIDQPEYLNSSMKTLMVPYYKDSNEFLSATDYPNFKYLIGHQGVKELTIGSGYQENEAVDLSSLKQFKQVIMGHYHTPQEKDNVVFLGSPFSHSFSESNEDKRLGIFNEKDGLISYVDMDFPRHMTYEIDCSPAETLPTQLKFFEINSKDYNRIILTGRAEDIAIFPKDQYSNVKFIEQPDTEKTEAVIKETESHDVMFKKWLNEVKQEDNMDIESIGLEILKEVK